MALRFSTRYKPTMKTISDDKRVPMDAISEVKMQANAAYGSVKGLVKSVGLTPVVGAAAVYTAHIRQMDRQNGTAPTQRQRDTMGRER
jgi:hypothetical protein